MRSSSETSSAKRSNFVLCEKAVGFLGVLLLLGLRLGFLVGAFWGRAARMSMGRGTPSELEPRLGIFRFVPVGDLSVGGWVGGADEEELSSSGAVS